MSEPFIGIDFGTCNSSAAWFDPRTGRAEPLRNAEGEDKTPSVVYFGPGNQVVVGRYAEERLESPDERQRVVSSVKRNLAKKFAQVVDGRPVTPLEVAALILGKLRWDAEQSHFHEPVTRAVITYPAVFDEVEKDQLREAARRAGFLEVELLEEPVAAADAYTRNGIGVGSHVLVYDLGGGTFDLAWLAREDGNQEYRLAMEPRGKRIGGEDFDRAVYDHFEAQVQKQTERPICPDGLDLDLLRRCRRVKESLSASEESVPIAWRGHGLKLKLRLTRASFEGLVENHVELTMRLTRSIKEDALAAGYPLESVILIGGASRTPCIIRRLHETLEVEPRKWEKQDVAVALGAAYHANRLWGDRAGREQSRSEQGYDLDPPIGQPPRGDSHKKPSAGPTNEHTSQKGARDSKPQPEPKNGAPHEAGDRRPCPVCAEMIKISATRCRFCGESLVETPSAAAPKPKVSNSALASRGSRLGAVVVDVIIATVAFFCVALVFSVATGSGPVTLTASGAIALFLGGTQIYLLSKRGQTIGKEFMGIRIIKQDGENPGFVGAVLRRGVLPGLINAIPYVGLVFCILDLSFIFSETRRCLHDRMAGTIVVNIAEWERLHPDDQDEDADQDDSDDPYFGYATAYS